MKDIYMRTSNSRTYNPRVIEYEDITEEILQQIIMLLMTNKGEVLGLPNYGVSLETLIFTLELNNRSLEMEINRQVRLYIPEAQKLGFKVNVKFYEGTTQDLCLIDIFLKDQKAFGIVI